MASSQVVSKNRFDPERGTFKREKNVRFSGNLNMKVSFPIDIWTLQITNPVKISYTKIG